MYESLSILDLVQNALPNSPLSIIRLLAGIISPSIGALLWLPPSSNNEGKNIFLSITLACQLDAGADSIFVALIALIAPKDKRFKNVVFSQASISLSE